MTSTLSTVQPNRANTSRLRAQWKEGDGYFPTPALLVEFGIAPSIWRRELAYPFTQHSGYAEVRANRESEIVKSFPLVVRSTSRMAANTFWFVFERFRYDFALESALLSLRARMLDLIGTAEECEASEFFLHRRCAFGAGRSAKFSVPVAGSVFFKLAELMHACLRNGLRIYRNYDCWRIAAVSGLHVPCFCISRAFTSSQVSPKHSVSILAEASQFSAHCAEALESAGFDVRTLSLDWRMTDSFDSRPGKIGSSILLCEIRLLDRYFLERLPRPLPPIIALYDPSESDLRKELMSLGVILSFNRRDPLSLLVSLCEALARARTPLIQSDFWTEDDSGGNIPHAGTEPLPADQLGRPHRPASLPVPFRDNL